MIRKSRSERMMDTIADEDSGVNKGARIVIAASIIILLVIVIAKYVTGVWTV